MRFGDCPRNPFPFFSFPLFSGISDLLGFYSFRWDRRETPDIHTIELLLSDWTLSEKTIKKHGLEVHWHGPCRYYASRTGSPHLYSISYMRNCSALVHIDDSPNHLWVRTKTSSFNKKNFPTTRMSYCTYTQYLNFHWGCRSYKGALGDPVYWLRCSIDLRSHCYSSTHITVWINFVYEPHLERLIVQEENTGNVFIVSIVPCRLDSILGTIDFLSYLKLHVDQEAVFLTALAHHFRIS